MVFPQLLWGNRLSLIKRNVTYLPRQEGGIGMIDPIVFLFSDTKVQSWYYVSRDTAGMGG